ncbi:MAG: tripartite tricarboxylate transporter substrate binding protein [Euzebyales bacterium]|nr:tripartite tricarboxylate transporter substrate binding protein [Euzebyales bacterium]
MRPSWYRRSRSIALLCVAALALAACQEGGGQGAAPEEEEEGAGPSQDEVVAEIDAIAEQVEAGELAYEAGGDSDEAIDALREVIPQPEGYPARAVEIIIGFGEGGGSDNYTRNVGLDAERIMGQRLIYNNVPGASGEVGLGQMFTQAADGYTIASAITNQVINDALGTQPYSFVDDVAFIIRQQGPTEIYWVPTDSEFETFEDMLEFAAENPGQVTVSGSGIGSDDEFRLLALGAELDTEFGYVPFDGVGDRISALLGGDIDVLHETAGTVIDLYEDGQIRPLAYGGDIVFEDIDPEIPSVADLGYPVPIGRWRGMVAPGEVDPAIVDYLHNVFYAAAQLPAYREFEAAFFQDVAGGYLDGEDFRAESLAERDEVAALAEQFGYDTEQLEE